MLDLNANAELQKIVELSGNILNTLYILFRLVVSGSSDNTIRLWDIESGQCLRVLEGHEELVRCIRCVCVCVLLR